MMSNKSRPFLFARKRSIPIERVYLALAQLNLPPTNKIKPERRETYVPIGSHEFIYSYRPKSDLREITFEQSQQVISLL